MKTTQRRPGRLLGAAALLLSALLAVPASAGERGDTNRDGLRSLADSHLIDTYLFGGGPRPSCFESADTSGDGRINLLDSILLLNFLFNAGEAPCVGADDSCEEPANEPISDPASSLHVIDSSVDEAAGVAHVTIGLTTSRELAGYSLELAVDGDVFANQQSGELEDLSGLDGGEFTQVKIMGERAVVAYLGSIVAADSIPAGFDGPVAEVAICLGAGTSAGDYDIEIAAGELVDFHTSEAILPSLAGGSLAVESDLGEVGCADEDDPETPPGESCGASPPPPPPPPPPPGEQVDFIRGDANQDGRVSISDALHIRRWLFNGKAAPGCLDAADADDNGQLTISDMIFILHAAFLSEDVIPAPFPEIGPDSDEDGISCESYEIVEPAETNDVVRIGDVTVAPGQDVDIPVFLSNELGIEAFQLIVEYDPEVFVPEFDILELGGTFYENNVEGPYMAIRQLSGTTDTMTVSFIPSLVSEDFEAPPGEERLVFKIPGRISESAEPGTTSLLVPTNGPDGNGNGPLSLVNELTHRGSATFVSTIPETLPGAMQIVPDITIFVRGDANGDDAVDQSDAVFILGALFLATEEPKCPDAADANDDGRVDVSDPIAILSTRFLGDSMIPAPYPAAGQDQTSDRLPRCRW